jgi:hypothetical protein
MEPQSKKAKVWRNLMVATANAAIEQGLFGRISTPDEKIADRTTVRFEFELDGLRCDATASDAGWDEVSLICSLGTPTTLWANKPYRDWGDVWVHGWLERRTGFWLQTHPRTGAGSLFKCRRGIVDRLANIAVTPNGFQDHGQFFI